MGNLCSRSSNEPDHFSSPGRVIGSAPPIPASVPVPKTTNPNSPGRPLGGGIDRSEDPSDLRTAAATAAERRAQATPQGTSGGSLSAKLREEQRQTMGALRAAASKEEQKKRAAEEANEVRMYN